MNARQILAENIKRYRIRLGISQEALADYLGIHREEVSYYENGRRNIPQKSISGMAKLFGVDECVLFEENMEVSSLNLAFAFRADELNRNDLEAIAFFKKMAMNYLKMKNANDRK